MVIGLGQAGRQIDARSALVNHSLPTPLNGLFLTGTDLDVNIFFFLIIDQ